MALIDRIVKAGQEMIPIPGAGATGLVKPRPMDEVGVSGLLRTKGVGYVFEEWLRDLSTYRQKMVYREMRDNDAVIGAMFFALEMILRKAEWRVEPADVESIKKVNEYDANGNRNGKSAKGALAKANQYSDFTSQCLEDMSHTWEEFIAECVSEFAFGFSLFETVYKRRKGPDGRKASKYDDGLIGWRKFAARAQESILYWIWDDEGGLQGAVQLAAPDYRTVPIPIEKLLLFRTTSLKNNPEGRSLLRNCYRSWFFKRRIEEVEGIGIERDLCGIPVLYASAEAQEAMGGINNCRTLVRNLRIDDQMGVVLPLAYDDDGNPLIKLELLKAAGSKQTDPNASIQRYNSDMLNTILAGFIQLGQTPTGSFSLHMSASQIFAQAIGAFMDSVAAVINRIATPRLMRLNGMDQSAAPKLVPGEIGVRDLNDLSTFVQRLAMSGLTFFDKPTSDYLRKAARLPEQPDEPVPMQAGAPEGGLQGPPQAQPPQQGAPPNQAPPAKQSWGAGKPKVPQAGPKKPVESDVPTEAEAKERLQEE